MTYIPRDRLNTRLPPLFWRELRKLAASWGMTHDQAVRRLIADACGITPVASQDAPGDEFSPSRLKDPHDTLLVP